MFALLISLSSLAQREGGGGDELIEEPPGGGIQCLDPYSIEVSHTLFSDNGLPCAEPFGTGVNQGEGISQPKYFVLKPTALNNGTGYSISSDKPITWSTVAPPPGLSVQPNDIVFRVVFWQTGWQNLTFNGNPLCEIPFVVTLPVLCNCPTVNYKVLGRPNTTTIIAGSNINQLSSSLNYVIGNLEFNSSQSPSGVAQIYAKKFVVLGNNAYNTFIPGSADNKPGGSIFGPFIKFTNRYVGSLISSGNKWDITENAGIWNEFYGDPCFGMWGGIILDDSVDNYNDLASRLKATKISDALVGINFKAGSKNAFDLTDVEIDACMYGIITTRDALKSISSSQINYGNKEFLKPFDYPNTGYCQNCLTNKASENLFSWFYTNTGVWQASDRVDNNLNVLGLKIKSSMIGMRWGNGHNITSNLQEIKGIEVDDFHLAGMLFSVTGNFKIADSKITLKGLFAGDILTYQTLDMLPLFDQANVVSNINSSTRYSNRYGIYSRLLHSLTVENVEFWDKTIPKQQIYIDRPIGLFAMNLSSLTKSKFIFNDNYGTLSPSEEGNQSTAEVKGIGCFLQGKLNNFNLNPYQMIIRDNWFRNVRTGFLFDNTTISSIVVGCNYFQNVHTGFDFTDNSNLTSNFGSSSAPCGNRFTWNDTYYGLPNVAPNDCKVLVTMNNVTNQTYYRFSNEFSAFSFGNLLISNGLNPGNNQAHSNPTCRNAVRDPFSPKVNPTEQPLKPDPMQMGYYNLMGIKVAEVGTLEDSLPLGIYLKVDEEGKKIILK